MMTVFIKEVGCQFVFVLTCSRARDRTRDRDSDARHQDWVDNRLCLMKERERTDGIEQESV